MGSHTIRGRGFGIVGLAVCLPTEVRDNSFWPPGWAASRAADPTRQAQAQAGGDEIPESVRAYVTDPYQGARLRRVISDAHESSDLEAAACRAALASAGRSSDDVDMLFGYSQVSDDAGPGNHGIVAHRLGLPPAVLASTVESGCASFVPHVTLASRLLGTGAETTALLYQSSATSRITDYDLASSVVTGDGAAAQVVGEVDDGLGFVDALHYTRGELRDGLVLAPKQCTGRWYDDQDSPLVIAARDPAQAVRMGALGPHYCQEACEALLTRNGLTADDVDYFVCAQAGAWFAPLCAAAVGIDADRFVAPEDHFQHYGHLLAASAPLNLWVAWTSGRLNKGDLILVYSPGVGFTQAAVLLRWSMDGPPAGVAPVTP